MRKRSIKYIIAVLSLVSPLLVSAQICTGALGDNIFLDGDFGSGTSNLLSPDPNIAPGYSYSFSVPPLDGSYIVTNSTVVWPGLWNTWLQIEDNSDDPNGYMMVVNASTSPGLFYEQTVSGLCQNSTYEFSADIINLIKSGTPNHIDPDVSFLLDGVEFFNTGNIPKTNNWTTYGFTFTTGVNQESLTLSLRNNAPGGNGNDLALDNISFRACGPEVILSPSDSPVVLCSEDTPIQMSATIIGGEYNDPVYQWQVSNDGGNTWTDILNANGPEFTHPPLSSGTYTYRFLIADGMDNIGTEKCRVNSESFTIEVPTSEFLQADTICEGTEYLVGNSIYTSTGVYTDIFDGSLGCDSIVITDLTVLINENFDADIITTTACVGLENGSISIENVVGGVPPYQYTFEGNDEGTNSVYTNLMGGQSYSMVIKDDIGCTLEIDAFVDAPVELMLDLGEDQSIELGELIDVNPDYNFNPIDFNWELTPEIDCDNFSDCSNLNDLLLTESQWLSLTLFANGDCFVSDSIYVEVDLEKNLWFPNAFSPNNDGVNDYFTAFANPSKIEQIESLEVFDRWGNRVFSNENFQVNQKDGSWNGKFKGDVVIPGVYVYVANVRFVDGELTNSSGSVVVFP